MDAAVFEAIKGTQRLDILDARSNLEFIVSSFDGVVKPIIYTHDVIIIAGAYFGDEGKGKYTDAIARSPDIALVVRDLSGENAGHTVWFNGVKYIFNLTPSAIAIPGKICLIGPECVMDPINYMEKEVSSLVAAKIDYKDRLFVGNVHIVGPHHKILDFALSPPNSSTLMGMSYVHAAKVKRIGLRLDDLFNDFPDDSVTRLKRDLDDYHALLKHHGKDEKQILADLREFSKIKPIPRHLFDFLEAEDKVEYLKNLYREKVVDNPAFPKRADVTMMVSEALKERKKVLIESPQGYWISNATEKHWASSTSAQTHAAGVLAGSGINFRKYKIVVINVAKTPCDSRVGNGANPSSFVPQNYFSKRGISNLDALRNECLDFDEIQKKYFESIGENGILRPTVYHDKASDKDFIISEAMAIASARTHDECGSTTKKPRVTGLFDCVAAYQVNQAQGSNLIISALDRGDLFDHVGLTIAYVFHNPSLIKPVDSNGKLYKNGDIIRIGDQYPCDNVLKHCHPIIKVLPGWKDSPIGGQKLNPGEKLPENVQNFLSEIETHTGFNIIGIGNGQDSKDTIYLRKDTLWQRFVSIVERFKYH
ncbi:MAG: adenylosuccinate synthetase [archaeon]